MALEVFAGAFLSASLQVLFDRLASPEVWSFIRGKKVSDELLLELGIKLLVVDKVLDHAEVKQFTDESVKKWLVQVKNAVYDAEDLLDEIATEALRCKMEAADSHTGPTLVLSSFSTWFEALLVDHQSMESRVKKIINELAVLAQATEVLDLKGDGKKLRQRSPSTSLVDEFCVFGRDEVKEDMIRRLLSDNTSRNKIDVISIVGMGGAGKTTLAQLLYNDGRVKGHFHLKVWVCVSEEFCLLKVTKSILEGIGSLTSSDMQSENLDLLQQKLKESLGDKKFLLVLDDVWEKCPSEWEGLRILLLAVGEGSKVVVTTRNRNVAKIMRADHTHPLERLSETHCWSLFKKLAFENGDSTPYPQLESIGRKIVANCQGLPLAVKALGSLLYSKADRREWEQILDSEIWGQDLQILPSLLLSYRDLPLHLKRCFAYCSIFPKNHEFDKEKLILLWMAEGLLHISKSNERMGKVGEQYFDELLSKSFFQKSVIKESFFVIHDLIHDLAQYTSTEFCIRFEDDQVQEISKNTRHALDFKSNFYRMVVLNRFEALANIKCLRTYFKLKEVEWDFYKLSKRVDLHAVLSKWRYLRVLSLCSYVLIDLPDSIGELKYLRYLDISYTNIKKLPDSVCYLYNLQTMILSGCDYLIELPSRMDKLINLRYLDVSGWREMPSHISRLRNLQKLSNFIVGQKDGLRISELGKLSDIGGRLEISEMQNVVCARDALGANMKDKRHLDELALKWSNEVESGLADHILNNLQPQPNLRQLTIKGYPGVAFPNWLGGPSLLNLVSLRLESCKNCSSLPPLGQLPSLKHLSILAMKRVERVGSEFYGEVSSSITSKPSFPFLQTLRFEEMDNWEKWLCCGCEFHRLQELYLIHCPKLTGKLPEELPSLKKLKIDRCWRLLVASLQVPAICELKMVHFGELQLKRPAFGFTALQASHIGISNVSQWKQLLLEPHKLTITNPDAVESLLEGGILQTPTSPMQDLKIKGCCFSRSLHKVCLPTTLKSLEIRGCDNLGFLLPELFRCHHPSLEELKISRHTLRASSSFTLSFSLAIFPRLIHFDINALSGLTSLSISISEGEPTSLRSLQIFWCHDLKYIELPALDSACYQIAECSRLKLLKLLGHTLSFLQRLSLKNCPQLWFPKDGLNSNIRELEICRCNQLTPQVDWGLQRQASLTKFKISSEYGIPNSSFISGGWEDVKSFPQEGLLPSTLTTLKIECIPNLKSLDGRGLQQLTSLTKLSIRHCPKLQFIPQEGFQNFASLTELEIQDCPSLQSFGEEVLRHLTSLERLFICQCDALQSLTGSGLQHLTSLKILDIRFCPKLQSLKEAGLASLACLKQLYIGEFPELQSLTEVGLQYLTSLEKIWIFNCPKLQSLTRERLPDSLSFLSIDNCPLLEPRCQFEEGQEWDYVAHIPQIFIGGELF